MVVLRTSSTQQPPSPPTPPTDGQRIGEQIRQSIQEATQEARDAVRQARDAQQRVRDAQQQLRDAQQRLSNAHTKDAAQEARAAVKDAETALREAERALRGTVVVHTGSSAGLQDVIPPQAVDISIAFFVMCAVMVIGWPLARAFGRRIERRGDVPALDAGATAQLQRIEQAVEAMAIEIERISESQRFMARLQSESSQGRGAPPAAERR
jgi:hypothetical protein